MVTLSKPVAGDTDWATEINDNWTKLENAVAGVPPVGGRLQRDSATQISFQRYAGNYADVNGEVVSIPSSGLTLAPSANRIAPDGTDAAANMAPSTLYYVYISNSLASFSPSSIRASEMAPSLLNGVKYLGISDNAANWRFLGWVRTNATGTDGEFEDNETNRLVVNYYNRVRKNILINPGYVNDNAFTSYTRSGNWTAANGGTGATGSFISNGEDAVSFVMSANVTVGDNIDAWAAIGMDTSTSPTRAARAAGSNATSDISTNVSTHRGMESEGYHTVNLCVAGTSGTVTYWSDGPRNGASADPRITMIEGEVMA